MNKRALIVGISGQDGAYLARALLGKGYEVYGTSRDAQTSAFSNLVELGIRDDVRVESLAPNDFRSVFQTLMKVRPDELYNLSGQSSVGLSFQQPVETFESISVATINILEAIRFAGGGIKFYNACSGESFGETVVPATEQTPFRPVSPYGVAKAAAFWQVANYREAYGLFCCSGILFNHESPLRPERFVTRKIIKAVCGIGAGQLTRLRLGNIAIHRDWGWAPEYVEAMWLMLQNNVPSDYVVATGQTCSLREFIAVAFAQFNLAWEDYIVFEPEFTRPNEIHFSGADPSRAKNELGWSAEMKMEDVVRHMIDHEIGKGTGGF